MHIVFPSRALADKFSSDIDTELGYPKAGVPIGSGHTSVGARGVTTRFAGVIKHPTLNRWAYPDDPVIRGKRGRIPLPAGAVVEELDATWAESVLTFRAKDIE